MLGGYTPSRIMGVISQGAQHLLLEGSTLYYGPLSSGALALSLAPADGQSGLAAVGFPALFGQDAALLNAAPYQVSYGLDPGQEMSGYYTLSAADRVGNQASSPQFRLVKDGTAPTAEVYVPAQPALAFRVNWQGQDSQAGVAYYDLQYREKDAQDWGNWLDWQTGTQETSARFVGQAGYEYQFRVRAADRVGNLGEWVTGSPAAVQNVTIYYYAGSVRVAMRQGERVTYLLADHLGSTQVTADEQGSELGRYLYTAWVETRQVSGESATDRLYTGQRQEAEIGLYYYNARWYDPALGRFVQADTIVPNSNYPLAYDRYAYAYNNPIRYNDPSGHTVCDEEGWCHNQQGWYAARGKQKTATETWKKLIKCEFGINMSDGGNKKWDNTNLQLMHQSLGVINEALNGRLRQMVAGAAFTLMNQNPTGEGEYHGATHLQVPTGIDFYNLGSAPLRQMNIYHEVGHLLDNTPGFWNFFTIAVSNENNPTWILNNVINQKALIALYVTNDPNYSSVQARQTFSKFGPSEQWADAFANYIAGNIDLSDPNGPGTAMYNFVRDVLAP